MHKNIEDRKRHTLSWSVMESCWLVGARIIEPVADFSPNLANELWVVNHEYLLNGSVLTCSCINAQPHQTVADRPNWKWTEKIKQIGYLRNGVYGLGSGAFGHHVAVCNARLAVQARVTVAVLDAFLPLLEIAENRGNRANRVKNGWCRF